MNYLQGERYNWLFPELDEQAVLNIATTYKLSISIAQFLYTRGYRTKEQLSEYLFSSFGKDVHHPSKIKDMDKAVARVQTAIKNEEKILVFGDYDVDGITSSAIMMLCMKSLGAKVNFYLPVRAKEGYGLSTAVVKKAAENGYTVIITVDNGITAFEPAEEAKKHGIDLIITDHHRPHDKKPDAYAIVDPAQPECTYPFKYLAGVGVSFKFVSLLFEFEQQNLPEKVYELLLLGTVADVVPLTGENRFWVRYGLRLINKIESYSFKVLKQNGSLVKPIITSQDIGFSITPQINALGRLEDPRRGVQFLIGSNKEETDDVGLILFELNQTRKQIERNILEEIEREIEKKNIDVANERVIIAASDKWPTGVIGLVASRLTSKYCRPTLLFHLTKIGVAKGSCRSITEFNIFDALKESENLLLQFGGHSCAAGLSLKTENIPALKQKLEELASKKLTEFDLQPKFMLDAEIKLSDLSKKFISDLDYLEPFGHQNSKPIFWVKQVVLVQKPKMLKDLHIKCSVFADGVIKSVIFFNRPELFEKLVQQASEPFDLAAEVTENHWNGNVNIELLGIDVAGLNKN